jgi:hypothetical protein
MKNRKKTGEEKQKESGIKGRRQRTKLPLLLRHMAPFVILYLSAASIGKGNREAISTVCPYPALPPTPLADVSINSSRSICKGDRIYAHGRRTIGRV